MRHIEKKIADMLWETFLCKRSPSGEGEDATAWVVTETREQGLDVTYRLVQRYAGTNKPVEIPHDSLPTQPAYNPKNGRSVFVLSQPNHIPTVQTTMQGTLADLRDQRTEPLSDIERDYADVKGQEFGFGSDAFADKLILDAQEQEMKPKKPDVLIIDQEYPMWKVLRPYAIDPNIAVWFSERVASPRVPSSEAEMGKDRQFEGES